MVTTLTDRPQARAGVPWLIGLVLVGFSFLDAQRGYLSLALHGLKDPDAMYAGDLAGRLRGKNIGGPVAGAGDYDAAWSGEVVGLYVAFLLDQPFYGSDPHPTASAFKESGAGLIVLDRTAPVIAELAGDASFVDLDRLLFQSESEAKRYPLKVFQRSDSSQ